MLQNALNIFLENQQLFITGIKNTLVVSLIGTIVGLLLGFVLSMLRDIQINDHDSTIVKSLKKLSILFTNFYIEFVRGTPMMVQAVFLYYSLYRILNWTPMTASLIIVSFNTASYMAEILRAGIQSVNKGQREAALAIGMTQQTAFRKIILPQALRNSFPSIGNEFVVNIKDTSVLNVISMNELFNQGMSYAGRTYQFSEAMFILLVIYFVLTFTTTRLLGLIERKLNQTKVMVIQ